MMTSKNRQRTGLWRLLASRLRPQVFHLLVGLAPPALLAGCGEAAPVEDPQAKVYYERALRAKESGDQPRYLALLRHLSEEYEDSKYGRRARLVLASPAYDQGEASEEAKAYDDFRKKIRAAGIRETLRQIYEAERRYYSSPRNGVFEEPLPARFIAAGPIPPEVPKGRAILPAAPGFDEPGWRTLRFSQSGPMRFQYTVLTQGEGAGARLIVRALGDLDGDGIYSVYELHAEADASGVVSQRGDIRVRDEGE
jgi:hypothetical protein